MWKQWALEKLGIREHTKESQEFDDAMRLYTNSKEGLKNITKIADKLPTAATGYVGAEKELDLLLGGLMFDREIPKAHEYVAIKQRLTQQMEAAHAHLQKVLSSPLASLVTKELASTREAKREFEKARREMDAHKATSGNEEQEKGALLKRYLERKRDFLEKLQTLEDAKRRIAEDHLRQYLVGEATAFYECLLALAAVGIEPSVQHAVRSPMLRGMPMAPLAAAVPSTSLAAASDAPVTVTTVEETRHKGSVQREITKYEVLVPTDANGAAMTAMCEECDEACPPGLNAALRAQKDRAKDQASPSGSPSSPERVIQVTSTKISRDSLEQEAEAASSSSRMERPADAKESTPRGLPAVAPAPSNGIVAKAMAQVKQALEAFEAHELANPSVAEGKKEAQQPGEITNEVPRPDAAKGEASDRLESAGGRNPQGTRSEQNMDWESPAAGHHESYNKVDNTTKEETNTGGTSLVEKVVSALDQVSESGEVEDVSGGAGAGAGGAGAGGAGAGSKVEHNEGADNRADENETRPDAIKSPVSSEVESTLP